MSAGRQAVVDAVDVDLVIRARQLRRRRRPLAAIAVSALIFVGLSAVAVPNFVKFGCRSKQSEAKSNLKALWSAQQSHRAEHGRYSASFTELDFTPKAHRLRYRYVIGDIDVDAGDPAKKSPFPRSFRAWAFSVDPGFDDDVWTIDDDSALVHVQDGCR